MPSALIWLLIVVLIGARIAFFDAISSVTSDAAAIKHASEGGPVVVEIASARGDR